MASEDMALNLTMGMTLQQIIDVVRRLCVDRKKSSTYKMQNGSKQPDGKLSMSCVILIVGCDILPLLVVGMSSRDISNGVTSVCLLEVGSIKFSLRHIIDEDCFTSIC